MVVVEIINEYFGSYVRLFIRSLVAARMGLGKEQDNQKQGARTSLWLFSAVFLVI